MWPLLARGKYSVVAVEHLVNNRLEFTTHAECDPSGGRHRTKWGPPKSNRDPCRAFITWRSNGTSGRCGV